MPCVPSLQSIKPYTKFLALPCIPSPAAAQDSQATRKRELHARCLGELSLIPAPREGWLRVLSSSDRLSPDQNKASLPGECKAIRQGRPGRMGSDGLQNRLAPGLGLGKGQQKLRGTFGTRVGHFRRLLPSSLWALQPGCTWSRLPVLPGKELPTAGRHAGEDSLEVTLERSALQPSSKGCELAFTKPDSAAGCGSDPSPLGWQKGRGTFCQKRAALGRREEGMRAVLLPELGNEPWLPSRRLLGDSWARVQQDVPWNRQLRGHVLRPGLRHNPCHTHHQVRVQVPLVLCCALQGVRGHRGRAHVQSAQAG